MATSLSVELLRRKLFIAPDKNWIELSKMVAAINKKVPDWEKKVLDTDESLIRQVQGSVATLRSKLNMRNSRTTYIADVEAQSEKVAEVDFVIVVGPELGVQKPSENATCAVAYVMGDRKLAFRRLREVHDTVLT